MKKIMVIAAALLMGISASAQHAGIVAGFTSSQLNISEAKITSAAGYQLGFAYNYPLGAGFAIQPELLYNVKASTVEALKNSNSAAEVGALAKMGYVEIPLQVQWGLNLMVVRPYVFAEPFVGCAVSGFLKDEDGKTKITFDDFSDRLEYGLGIGAGVELFSKLQVSAKYYWNLDQNDSFDSLVNNVSNNIKTERGFDGLVISAAIFF